MRGRVYLDELDHGVALDPEAFIARMRQEHKRFSRLGWDRCAAVALRTLERAKASHNAALDAERRQERVAERRMEEALYGYELEAV